MAIIFSFTSSFSLIRAFFYFPCIQFHLFSGGYSEEVTPVPIPNTEVKLFSADGTAWETVWESRTPPGSFYQEKGSSKRGLFLGVPRMPNRIPGYGLKGAESERLPVVFSRIYTQIKSFWVLDIPSEVPTISIGNKTRY